MDERRVVLPALSRPRRRMEYSEKVSRPHCAEYDGEKKLSYPPCS